MSWQPRARLPVLPAAAAALLLALLAVQAAVPGETPLPAPALARGPKLGAGVAAAAPVAAGIDITRRTIFAPSRRFDPPGAEGAPGSSGAGSVAADPLLGATVLGTALSRRERVAIIRDPAGQTGSHRIGSRVAGWRVAGIGRDGVTLVRQGVARRLAVGTPVAAIPAGPLLSAQPDEEE